VSRNDVPDQKASIAVPFSFSVMIGSAILKEVASSAAASVMIHIEVNARRKPRDGLKAGVTCSREGRFAESLSPGKLELSNAGISIVFSAVRASSKLGAGMAADVPKCVVECEEVDTSDEFTNSEMKVEIKEG
jgi:hypothetical protein